MINPNQLTINGTQTQRWSGVYQCDRDCVFAGGIGWIEAECPQEGGVCLCVHVCIKIMILNFDSF